MLGDEPRPFEHLFEVALGEALTLSDHAEAVSAGSLGGVSMGEHLLRLHHRVHRRVGLRMA